MQRNSKQQGPLCRASLLTSVLLAAPALLLAQSAPTPAPTAAPHRAHVMKTRAQRPAKKVIASQQVAQAPAPPPMPHWPINDSPNPASVVWDANGLRINASNSSLQQILSEVSTDTGTKVVGSVPDQRVYGTYGPGQAREVLSQLLQGSGYNVLLAGDLGHGAPSQIVLTPRRAGGSANASNGMNRPQQQDSDDDVSDQPQPEEEPQPQPPIQQPPPQMPNQVRPGFGPNGPMRTPQQIMEEMQQRQLLQQQQMQQQMQQQQQDQQQQNPEQ